MIDIIIPAFNAHKTLDRCIGSILSQVEPDLKITIVNDGGNGYDEVINRYKSVIDIQEIGYETNGGPGVARQYGYDHTNGDLVTFIDADDTFYSPFALKSLHIGIDMDGGYVACIGQFTEENHGQFLPHIQDMVWMFGKLYRRDFLDRYKIRFCPGSRWNEDNGFNTCMRLCTNEREKINFIPDTVYCWHEQPNSITRAENCRYSFDKSFVGFAENMIWAIKHTYKIAPFNGMIDQWAIMSFLNLYEYLVEAVAKDRRFLKQSWAWAQTYYDIIICPIKHKMTDEVLSSIYSDVLRNSYGRGSLNGIIPFMGIKEFIDKMEKKESIEFEDNDLSDYFPENSPWLYKE